MAANKTSQTPAKKTRKTQPKQSKKAKVLEEVADSRVKRLLRWSLWFTVKITVLLMFNLFIYSIYLDGKVRDKFEGQRWQVPVQVYGAIEEYTIGSQLSLSNLKQALIANRYKKVTDAQRPGEFALSTNRPHDPSKQNVLVCDHPDTHISFCVELNKSSNPKRIATTSTRQLVPNVSQRLSENLRNRHIPMRQAETVSTMSWFPPT